MYPHHWHWHRRPSRALWFIIGAASAAWWIKSKEADKWKTWHCSRRMIPQTSYPPPNAQPAAAKPEPMLNGNDARSEADGPMADRRRWGWNTNASPQQAQTPPAPPVPFPTDRWEEDRQRMQAVGKQATDTIVDLSEATLNSVTATVESLKAKLAELRAQRDQQEQQIKALREEQFKQFEEWRKQQEIQQQEQPPRHVV